jgi:hypothetical protein
MPRLFIFVALLARFDVLFVRAATRMPMRALRMLMGAAVGMFAALFAGFASAFRVVFKTPAAVLAAFALAGPATLLRHG